MVQSELIRQLLNISVQKSLGLAVPLRTWSSPPMTPNTYLRLHYIKKKPYIARYIKLYITTLSFDKKCILNFITIFLAPTELLSALFKNKEKARENIYWLQTNDLKVRLADGHFRFKQNSMFTAPCVLYSKTPTHKGVPFQE